jgi:hypothetical protein
MIRLRSNELPADGCHSLVVYVRNGTVRSSLPVDGCHPLVYGNILLASRCHSLVDFCLHVSSKTSLLIVFMSRHLFFLDSRYSWLTGSTLSTKDARVENYNDHLELINAPATDYAICLCRRVRDS